MNASGLVAPTRCQCDATIGLIRETWDAGDRVYVGTLVCARGHAWIDIRSPRETRPHGPAFPNQARRLDSWAAELEQAGRALAALSPGVQLGLELEVVAPAPAVETPAAASRPARRRGRQQLPLFEG